MTSNPYTLSDTVFVILRVEGAGDQERAPENTVHLLKALWSAAEAEAEVTRLNQAGKREHSDYFWKAVRLGRQPAIAGATIGSAVG